MAKATTIFCVAFLLGVVLPVPPRRADRSINHGSNTMLRSPPISHRGPEIVWLASFPNSGTSYTMALVQTASGQGVATNYGDSHLEKESGLSKPVYPNGPYWTDTSTNNSVPEHYVMTKTHCGGYCQGCKPGHYIESPHSFLTHCIESFGIVYDDTKNKTGKVTTYYPRDIVAKTVHLIRNPFDNIVSRYHLQLNKWANHNDTSGALQKFHRDREGFRSYCAALPKIENGRLVDRAALELLKDVPCHDEVFRMVQWHNLMFITSGSLLQVESMVVYYEDYETEFDATLANLLDFLKLPNVGKASKFVPGKTYVHYYTPEERAMVKRAIKQLASPKTWEHLERYFDAA